MNAHTTIDHVTQNARLLRGATSSADFDAAIAEIDARLKQAQRRRAELSVAEDRAALGDGDIVAVREELRTCGEAIDLFHKQLEGARRRRQEAVAVEANASAEEIAAAARADGADLELMYRQLRAAIESARDLLVRSDAQAAKVRGKNDQLRGLRRADLQVDPIATLGKVFCDTPPNRDSTRNYSVTTREADKVLKDMLSRGGTLFRIRGRFHPDAQRFPTPQPQPGK